jgi:hypothetical protein
MGKGEIKDLKKFVQPFPKEIQERVFWLRDFVWDLYPHANELIYDNYNAVAFGWSPTDKVGHVFCNIAIGRSSHNVHFGFYWGAELKDPEKKLLGEGNQYRYLRVPDLDTFPRAYIEKLMRDAYKNSMTKVKDKSQIMSGQTITKSISGKKRAAGKKVAAKAGKKVAPKAIKPSRKPKKKK